MAENPKFQSKACRDRLFTNLSDITKNEFLPAPVAGHRGRKYGQDHNSNGETMVPVLV